MILTTLKNVGYVVAAILGITYDMLLAFSLLIIIDVVTGVAASIVVRGRASFRSSTMARGAIIKCLYVLILLVIAELGIALDIDMKTFVKSVLGILAVSEAYSILANMYMIKTKRIVEEVDALTPIMNKVKRMYDAFIIK